VLRTRSRIGHFHVIVAVNHVVVWMIFQSRTFSWVLLSVIDLYDLNSATVLTLSATNGPLENTDIQLRVRHRVLPVTTVTFT